MHCRLIPFIALEVLLSLAVYVDIFIRAHLYYGRMSIDTVFAVLAVDTIHTVAPFE